VLLRWVAPADFSRPGPLVSLVLSPPQASITSSDEPARSAFLQTDKPKLNKFMILAAFLDVRFTIFMFLYHVCVDNQFTVSQTQSSKCPNPKTHLDFFTIQV
jgi:hypothetical protein